MLTALLLVASMGLAPAPAAVHPAPAAVAASPASQAADFAAWLGAEPAAAPSPVFAPAAATCLTSCSQCPKQTRYCCQDIETGCVTACSPSPIHCLGS